MKFRYVAAALFLAEVACLPSPAQARDGWEGRPSVCTSDNLRNDDAIKRCQEWVANAKQPRPNEGVSCCADGDAYITDDQWYDPKTHQLYSVVTADGYPNVPKGTRILIPNNRINNAAENGGNPTGHSITFGFPESGDGKVLGFFVYCYFGGTGS